jgi:hypothetical protein
MNKIKMKILKTKKMKKITLILMTVILFTVNTFSQSEESIGACDLITKIITENLSGAFIDSEGDKVKLDTYTLYKNIIQTNSSFSMISWEVKTNLIDKYSDFEVLNIWSKKYKDIYTMAFQITYCEDLFIMTYYEYNKSLEIGLYIKV